MGWHTNSLDHNSPHPNLNPLLYLTSLFSLIFKSSAPMIKQWPWFSSLMHVVIRMVHRKLINILHHVITQTTEDAMGWPRPYDITQSYLKKAWHPWTKENIGHQSCSYTLRGLLLSDSLMRNATHVSPTCGNEQAYTRQRLVLWEVWIVWNWRRQSPCTDSEYLLLPSPQMLSGLTTIS